MENEKNKDKFLIELENLTGDNIDLFTHRGFVRFLFRENKKFSLKRNCKLLF